MNTSELREYVLVIGSEEHRDPLHHSHDAEVGGTLADLRRCQGVHCGRVMHRAEDGKLTAMSEQHEARPPSRAKHLHAPHSPCLGGWSQRLFVTVC